MFSFIKDITVEQKDLAPGIIAHDKHGNLISGNKFLSTNIYSPCVSRMADGTVIYRNIHPNNFKIIKTKKDIKDPLYTYFGSYCSLIEEFYAYNLTSISTSTFFSGCTNLKKIFLPACTSVASGCFIFGNQLKDVYLFSTYGGLWYGFNSQTFASNINKIYVTEKNYDNWANVNPLQTYLEIFSGVY